MSPTARSPTIARTTMISSSVTPACRRARVMSLLRLARIPAVNIVGGAFLLVRAERHHTKGDVLREPFATLHDVGTAPRILDVLRIGVLDDILEALRAGGVRVVVLPRLVGVVGEALGLHEGDVYFCLSQPLEHHRPDQDPHD